MDSLMRFFPVLLHNLDRLRCYLMRPLTVGVRLILVRDAKFLLVKHTYQPYWYLPGGGVKKDETLEQSARREAQEEVGGRLSTLRLLGVYSNFYEYKSDHVVVFVCEDFEIEACKSGEIEAVAFFSFADLPENISSGSRRRLAEYVSEPSATHVGRW
ncbi:MAG: NUDIX domain-containing protein [Anaerolineae bacterium]|nr:NUDIX domain-containing protein [Anaerolineae bacterium]